MRMNRLLLPGCVAFFVLAAMTEPLSAKPRYYDQIRVLLISRMASCTACHTAPAGTKLNVYGERIAAQPKNMTMADRILRIEREKRSQGNQPDDTDGPSDSDVDNDGVPNWIEILAQTSPANAKKKPDAAVVEKIKSVVSCHICHRETGLPGNGLTANPHNELGELLAKTVAPGKGAKASKDDHDAQAAAERRSILSRFEQVRTKKPKGSPASYWQKLRMLHAPADTKDNVTAAEVKEFKKVVAQQKRRKKKDPRHGLDCAAHPFDGFLLDAPKLE